MPDDDTPALRALAESPLAYDVVRTEPPSNIEESAARQGIEVSALVRTIVVRRGPEDYVFVLVPGGRQIDWPKLRAHLGVKRLSLPDADEASGVTGYERGAITPFGATSDWPVVADASIDALDRVAIGGGARGVNLHLRGRDLLVATHARSADVTRRGGGTQMAEGTDVAEVDERPPRWREVFSGPRGRLTAGLLLLEALVAVQALVVATILPDVRRDLGGTSLYGLVFTASSLATLAAIPIAGRAVDRSGSRAVLPPVLGLFGAGLLIAALAPAMPVLLAGQFVMGAGGGGLYALSLGTVATTFPDRLRPRVMALMASMWILPGLFAPPFAALLASTVGWRWAYVAPIPLMLVGWILITPALVRGSPAEGPARSSPVRWSLQLMVGAGLVLGSITIARWWALAPIAAGSAIGLPALARLVPAGTFRAARGAPATAASAFLLSVGFFAMDAFLTLMLTTVRHLSLAEASLAVTTATLTWATGSAWQSGRAQRIALSRIVVGGTTLLLIGEAIVATTLWSGVPVATAFLGWGVVGFAMGIVFPTLPLATMRVSGRGQEAGAVASVLLMDVLGVAVGAGLGGGAVAVSQAVGAPLASGIAASFAIALATLIVLLVTGSRIGPRAAVAS